VAACQHGPLGAFGERDAALDLFGRGQHVLRDHVDVVYEFLVHAWNSPDAWRLRRLKSGAMRGSMSLPDGLVATKPCFRDSIERWNGR